MRIRGIVRSAGALNIFLLQPARGRHQVRRHPGKYFSVLAATCFTQTEECSRCSLDKHGDAMECITRLWKRSILCLLFKAPVNYLQTKANKRMIPGGETGLHQIAPVALFFDVHSLSRTNSAIDADRPIIADIARHSVGD